MKKTLALAALGLLIGTVDIAAQEQIMVGGAGSMVPLMQELAKAYQTKHAGDRIEIMPKSLGSSGGIKATDAGRLAIGLTGRPLKASEQGKLVHRGLGVMPVVIAVHRDVPVATLKEAQICAIFSGQVTSWKDLGGPDAKILPLTRNEDDSDKEALRAMVGCYKDLKEAAHVVVLTKGSEMTAALGSRPGTIGLTTYAATLKASGAFKAVAIEGVAPAPDSVRADRYKLVKNFGVVTVGEPRGLAQRFLTFVAGPEGEQIMTQTGVVVRR